MKKRYGLIVDLERCTGCRACTVACKVENNMDSGTGIRVETIGGAKQDTPGGAYPDLNMHFLPVACMHCDQPPCRDACPTEAILKRPDGIVLIDEKRCNGCQECLPACPYQVVIYDPDRALARKCHLCFERIDQGFEPFCVLCCGYGAMFFGDLGDPNSHISHLLAQRTSYVLKPELATEPAIHYFPPKAPRQP